MLKRGGYALSMNLIDNCQTHFRPYLHCLPCSIDDRDREIATMSKEQLSIKELDVTMDKATNIPSSFAEGEVFEASVIVILIVASFRIRFVLKSILLLDNIIL